MSNEPQIPGEGQQIKMEPVTSPAPPLPNGIVTWTPTVVPQPATIVEGVAQATDGLSKLPGKLPGKVE